MAILVPTRKELAKVVKRLADNNWPLEGASDHGVSEAIYLSDPDGIGIEIYTDRPKEKWELDASGNPVMGVKPLDLKKFLSEI